jgi:hypothetical protein
MVNWDVCRTNRLVVGLDAPLPILDLRADRKARPGRQPFSRNRRLYSPGGRRKVLYGGTIGETMANEPGRCPGPAGAILKATG